jgi:hypothetical protein
MEETLTTCDPLLVRYVLGAGAAAGAGVEAVVFEGVAAAV